MYSAKDWQTQSITYEKKGAKNILLLHGFVGSPYDLKPLADQLRKVYSIHIPFLTIPTKDGSNTWNEVQFAWNNFQPDAVVGFSMGGTLAMLLPDCPKIIFAPYRGLPHFNRTATHAAIWFSGIISAVPKIRSGRIRSKKGRKVYKPSQWWVPTSSFSALQNLVKKSIKPNPDTPLMWIHSPSDPVASYTEAKRQWGDSAQHLLIPNVEHVLLYEKEAPLMIEKSLVFLKNHI
jgi:esterase/lipase